jgi:PAS domain S-box-containing protein
MCEVELYSGRFLRVNRRFCEMTGYDEAELVGRPFSEITHVDDRNFNVEAFGCLCRGEMPQYRMQKRNVRKDGAIIWVDVTVNLLRDANGEPLHAVAVVQDVTDRKQAEEALRESEERLRLAQVSAGIGSWDLNLLTGELIWSPENCRLYGVEPASFSCRYEGWRERIHPDDLPRAEREREQAIAARAPYQIEYRIIRPSGEIRWICSHGKAFHDDQGVSTRMLGISIDITERKRMEDEIQQYVLALQEADRRKDEFIATLAHELRNPLAPIRSCVEMFRLCAPGDHDFEWGRNLIEQQVGHMGRLVDDLLDISRITRNKLNLKKEKISLTQVLEAAVQSTRSIMEQRCHQLILTVPGEPIEVVADAVRLTQVFVNLLHNAAKYTAQGGRIELVVERDGGIAAVRVTDNGVGMPADKLPFIFGMFYQAERLYEEGHGGLGIGLTLVKRLVEMHGGTVEAHSPGINQGSEFIVRLPISVEESRPVMSEQQSPESAPARRILVVDDYPNAAESLARWLRRMGNEVQTALDGLEGVQAAEAFRPQVVLLDIGMPKLDGYEAARRIRAQPWGKQILLVAVTGWGQAEDRQRTQAAGFDVHLVKPIDHSQLTTLLGTLAPSQVN